MTRKNQREPLGFGAFIGLGAAALVVLLAAVSLHPDPETGRWIGLAAASPLLVWLLLDMGRSVKSEAKSAKRAKAAKRERVKAGAR